MHLNTLQPAPGSKTKSKRLVAVLAQVKVKLAVEVIKVKEQVLVVFIKSVLKAVKCLYKDVYLNQVFVQDKLYS